MARSDWAIGGILALCALLPRLALAEMPPPALNVAYTMQNEPPYVLMSGGELDAGLIHDIGVELAVALQRRPVFVLLSRNRIEAGPAGRPDRRGVGRDAHRRPDRGDPRPLSVNRPRAVATKACQPVELSRMSWVLLSPAPERPLCGAPRRTVRNRSPEERFQ